jgi:hypothetical protein
MKCAHDWNAGVGDDTTHESIFDFSHPNPNPNPRCMLIFLGIMSTGTKEIGVGLRGEEERAF